MKQMEQMEHAIGIFETDFVLQSVTKTAIPTFDVIAQVLCFQRSEQYCPTKSAKTVEQAEQIVAANYESVTISEPKSD